MTTLTIESPVRQRLPNDISSLKTWAAPILPSHIDTFSPKVGVPANDDEVVVHNIDQVQNANWFSTTARALLELLYLPDGWDSYGAKQVKPRAVEKMLETLMSILEPNTPTPAVVPTSQGGVQVEWHRSQVDFEIEVTSSGELSFFFKSPTEEQEGSVKEDQTVLKKYIRTIKAT